jgi:hypothetical protein
MLATVCERYDLPPTIDRFGRLGRERACLPVAPARIRLNIWNLSHVAMIRLEPEELLSQHGEGLMSHRVKGFDHLVCPTRISAIRVPITTWAHPRKVTRLIA